MDRFLFFSFLIFVTFFDAKAQNKFNVSLGGGMVIHNHTQTDFDSSDRSFLEESKSTSISYGFNSYFSYFPHRMIMVRTGVNFNTAKFDGFTTIKSVQSFGIPVYIGLNWKNLMLYSGFEYDASFYTFIFRENLGFEITKDNCNCVLERNSYNVPLGLEYGLAKHFAIGLKYQFLTNDKVKTPIRKDELKNTYLYFNYTF